MNTQSHTRKRNILLPTLAALGVGTLLLSGCSADTAGESESGEFSYLSLTENTAVADTLTTLSTGACSAENEALPLTITKQPQASFDQQIQLLAGQGALPVIFAAGNTPQLAKDLFTAGQVLDLKATFADLGVEDALLPAASSTVESLYGSVIALPTEFNVEGIWYNKKILADNGIAEPATWEELSTAAATVDGSDLTAFSAAGKEGWPLTRLVANYLFRDIGPDALQKVADGEAKLTDPEYVKAAAAIAELGSKGYFGQGVGSIDYNASVNEFTTGKAAFFYMGSWILSAFNDAEANQIGVDNIGFMPFPNVKGGAGSSDQLAANVGVPLLVSKAAYGPKVGDWLSCITENFGAASLNDQGVLSGFAVNGDINVPALTESIIERTETAGDSVLWFEALFNAQATTTAQTNAAQLVTGAITPEEFMAKVQADLG